MATKTMVDWEAVTRDGKIELSYGAKRLLTEDVQRLLQQRSKSTYPHLFLVGVQTYDLAQGWDHTSSPLMGRSWHTRPKTPILLRNREQ